jgi:4-hydroxy-tetrahydrodipicolinate synthase
MAHGGHGSISVSANVAPVQVSAFHEAALSGDWETARRWQDGLLHLHRALFTDASPAPTKYALSKLGLCEETARLPITPASEASRREVDAALAEVGVA